MTHSNGSQSHQRYRSGQFWNRLSFWSISTIKQKAFHLNSIYVPTTVCSTDIKSIHDCEILQQDIDRLVRWSARWLMRFNVQKCTSISVHQLRSRYQDYPYKMNDVVLIRTMEQKYLGVMLTSDLRWYTHISKIASKANRSMGLVKRSLHMCQHDAKALAYTSLVRSHLEYASSAWDPYTDINKYKLEEVQHRATRIVTRNYNWKTPIVQELGWKTLEQRRWEHSLKLMFKVVICQSGLKCRTTAIRQQSESLARVHEKCYVPPQCRTDTYQPPQCRTDTYQPPQCRTDTYQPPQCPECRTDTYQQSFFPRTIREWNVLPLELVDSSRLDSFSAGLARYLYDWAPEPSTWPDGAVLLWRFNNWNWNWKPMLSTVI